MAISQQFARGTETTGFSVVANPVKVLGTTGSAQVTKVSSVGRGQNIAALCYMTAGGMLVPPLFVFPMKRMVDPLMYGCPVGYTGTVNVRGSGYINGSLFLRWMKLLVDTVGCTKENRHLLLLDSHERHISLEVILFARDAGVVMLTFPPHCTHRLQPLDRTFFRSLKAGYSRACDNWMTCQKGRSITQFDVIGLFTTATVASATSGSSAAGLWTFNDSKFDDELGNNDEAAQSGQSAILSELKMTCRQNRPSTMSSRDQSLVQLPTTLFRKQSVMPDQHRRSLYFLMYMQCWSPRRSSNM